MKKNIYKIYMSIGSLFLSTMVLAQKIPNRKVSPVSPSSPANNKVYPKDQVANTKNVKNQYNNQSGGNKKNSNNQSKGDSFKKTGQFIASGARGAAGNLSKVSNVVDRVLPATAANAPTLNDAKKMYPNGVWDNHNSLSPAERAEFLKKIGQNNPPITYKPMSPTMKAQLDKLKQAEMLHVQNELKCYQQSYQQSYQQMQPRMKSLMEHKELTKYRLKSLFNFSAKEMAAYDKQLNALAKYYGVDPNLPQKCPTPNGVDPKLPQKRPTPKPTTGSCNFEERMRRNPPVSVKHK